MGVELSRNNKSKPRAENTLKRSDVVRKLHHETGLSSTVSAELVSRVFDHISEALIRGDDVKLAGFGTFKLRQKAARLGRNPKTGEECTITSRKVVTFKPSVVMKERVESGLKIETDNQETGEEAAKMTPSETPIGSTEKRSRKSKESPAIKRKEWIALFELLGSFAFANPAFQARKTEAFIRSVLEVKTIIDPGAPVTRKSISSWVRLNLNRWSKWAETETLIPRFRANLDNLRNISHKPDIIFFMVDIAIAENDYGDLDQSLIAQAILEWDMPATIVSDIRYVCPEFIPDFPEIS